MREKREGRSSQSKLVRDKEMNQRKEKQYQNRSIYNMNDGEGGREGGREEEEMEEEEEEMVASVQLIQALEGTGRNYTIMVSQEDRVLQCEKRFKEQN